MSTKSSRDVFSDEDIYDRIFGAIQDHSLPPGTRLVEEALCETFGATRQRVRKVLSQLAFAHVVTIEPHRGASVSKPGIEEARQVFAARRVIESAIVRDLTGRLKPRDRAFLSEHIDREAQAARQSDRAEVIRLSGEFHLEIARINGNQVLEQFLRELVIRESLVIAAYERPGQSSCSYHEHATMLEAVAGNDPETSVRVTLEHLGNIEDRLDLNRDRDAPLDVSAVLLRRRSASR
ncbi:GntR family transcriptional regulator [Microvirga sp. BT689]|uniref:GntR family transcriptional regulator n=1 Tax=Microvirga arvi TaxID=2778731 RepID=UPI00195037A1|nr:GntR family transcriptional regulator [Microvirga arvi]MBM6583490.1 GntR family transcriptional regulator [Microvirga arvi]